MDGEVIPESYELSNNHQDLLINTYLKKGYSSILDQTDLLIRPATTLARYSIFDYNINIDDIMNGISSEDIIFEKFDKPKINKGQKQIKQYTYSEIKDAYDFVIHGEYQVPYDNFLYQRGLSIEQLKQKKTVLYYNEKIDFMISINQQKGFPRLSKNFIADVLNIFDIPEVKDLYSNKQFVREGLYFFNKYGTHFLNRTKYGSRFMWISELNLTKYDDASPHQTAKDETVFKAGAIAIETSRDQPNDRLTDFEISTELGDCEINPNEATMEKCVDNPSYKGLLGFEVEYIYRLFDSDKIKTQILNTDGTPIPNDKLKNIYVNLKFLLESLISSIDVRNNYIKDFIVYNNLRADFGEPLPCVKKYKSKRFGDLPESLYFQDLRIDRFNPVFRLDQSNKIDSNHLYVMSISRFQTYICNLKERLFTNDLISSPYLFNKKYLIGFHFILASELQTNGTKIDGDVDIADCHNFYVHKKSDINDIQGSEILLLCLKYTNVFLDNRIITDVKIKSFVNNECGNFSYNGRNYECLCEKSIQEYTKLIIKNPKHRELSNQHNNSTTNSTKRQKSLKLISKFLCYSRKINLDN